MYSFCESTSFEKFWLAVLSMKIMFSSGSEFEKLRTHYFRYLYNFNIDQKTFQTKIYSTRSCDFDNSDCTLFKYFIVIERNFWAIFSNLLFLLLFILIISMAISKENGLKLLLDIYITKYGW